MSVGLVVTVYDQFSQSSKQSGIQSAQQKCLKEAEELKANALPHEVWKKVPPVCDPEAISKLEQKTPTQKAILEMTDEQSTKKKFPSIIWFIVIGLIPTIITSFLNLQSTKNFALLLSSCLMKLKPLNN